MDTPKDNQNSGARTRVMAVLVILLVVVTVVVIQMIQKAPTAGAGGHGPPSGDGPPAMPPAAVIVTRVETETTRENVVVTGLLHAISKADVAAQEAGAVDSLFVREGDRVEEGDPLALLDIRRNTAQLNESKASLTAAENLLAQRKAELERAEKDLEMKSKLRKTNAVSESDLLDAQKSLTVAKSQHQAAAAGIDEAISRMELNTVQLGDLTVKAPFDGTIVTRHVDPGEWVSAGTSVVTVIATDPIEAWLRIPARYLGMIPDDAASFRIRQTSTGKLFTPDSIQQIPEVEGRSQLYTIVAKLSNPATKLTPGESITGIVPISELSPYLKVPKNAIVYSSQGPMIQIVKPPMGEGQMPTAKGIPVDLAFEREGNAFILSETAGFSEKDQVIVEGNQRLRPGQPLMIQPPSDKNAPPKER